MKYFALPWHNFICPWFGNDDSFLIPFPTGHVRPEKVRNIRARIRGKKLVVYEKKKCYQAQYKARHMG